MREPLDQLTDIVQPIAAAMGFDKVKLVTYKSRNDIVLPLSRTFTRDSEEDVAFPSKLEIFSADAYPDHKRNEAFIHCWNTIGSSSKYFAKALAERLTKAGYPARVTTFKGSTGVRVKYELNWNSVDKT